MITIWSEIWGSEFVSPTISSRPRWPPEGSRPSEWETPTQIKELRVKGSLHPKRPAVSCPLMSSDVVWCRLYPGRFMSSSTPCVTESRQFIFLLIFDSQETYLLNVFVKIMTSLKFTWKLLFMKKTLQLMYWLLITSKNERFNTINLLFTLKHNRINLMFDDSDHFFLSLLN